MKCDPRIVRLNSPTLDTTKLKGERRSVIEHGGKIAKRRGSNHLVPNSVQLMNCADFGSLIILHERNKGRV